jgi:hypothetical protein
LSLTQNPDLDGTHLSHRERQPELSACAAAGTGEHHQLAPLTATGRLSTDSAVRAPRLQFSVTLVAEVRMRGHVRKRCPAPQPGEPPCGNSCRHGWAYVVELPRTADGKRRQTWKSGFRTKREAAAALAQALVAVEQPQPSTLLAATYFRDWASRIDRKPATLATYRRLVEQRIGPACGSTLLADLSPDLLQTFYEHWLTSGLSATYVQLIHQVINKALGDAERHGLITKNPARSVEAPRKAVLDMQTWTADEVSRFLRQVTADRLFAMWRLFLTTGMRRGEVAALRWSDVDLDHARLSVRQTGNVINRVWTVGSPKGRGRGATRLLSLDPQTVTVLRAPGRPAARARRGSRTVAGVGAGVLSRGRHPAEPHEHRPPPGAPRASDRPAAYPGA